MNNCAANYDENNSTVGFGFADACASECSKKKIKSIAPSNQTAALSSECLFQLSFCNVRHTIERQRRQGRLFLSDGGLRCGWHQISIFIDPDSLNQEKICHTSSYFEVFVFFSLSNLLNVPFQEAHKSFWGKTILLTASVRL